MIKKTLLAFLICFLGLYFVHNPNPYKTIGKLIEDPLKEIRNIKSKRLLKQELSELSDKLKKQPPKWFLDQIKEDFSHIYKLPITKERFSKAENFIEKVKDFLAEGVDPVGFYKIKIINNRIYYSHPNKKYIEKNDRILDIFKALKLLSNNAALPNVEFIIYTWDILYFKIPEDIVPIFSFAKSKFNKNNVILFPDSLTLNYSPMMYYQILEINKQISWNDKENKAFWRGTNTGALYEQDNYFNSFTILHTKENWQNFPRIKLVDFSILYPELIDAKFNYIVQANSDIMEFLKIKYKGAKNASKRLHLSYKTQIIIDGNSATYPGYLWRMLSNSVNLKQDSDDIQWFYRLFKPWEHYVPIKRDMSDLKEKIEWVNTHDQEAKEMAERASKVVQENLKVTDIYWYIYVMLNEYKKLMDYEPQMEKGFILYEG